MSSSSVFRLIHFSDLHVTLRPHWSDMFHIKRWVGVANLYGRGRAARFSPAIQQQLIKTIPTLNPSAILITGDITSQSLTSEFTAAKQLLDPLITSYPTIMLHGNHDTYVHGAYQQMTQIFAQYMCTRDLQHPSIPLTINATKDIDEILGTTSTSHEYPHMIHLPHNITVITLSPCQPRRILSNGTYDRTQLMRLQMMLEHDDLAGRYIILATHYPLFSPDGKEYGYPSAKALETSPSFLSYLNLAINTKHRNHGVSNGDHLLHILRYVRHPPQLIIHGHRHKGYAIKWNRESKQGVGEGGGIIHQHEHVYVPQPTHIPIYDPGSSGLTQQAAFNMYDIISPLHTSPLAGVLFHDSETKMHVTRYVHDGKEFRPQNVPYETTPTATTT